MVSWIPTEFLVGVLTAVAALAGMALQGKLNRDAQRLAIEAENRRARADYFLKIEAESLLELLEVAERSQLLTAYFARQKSVGDFDLNEAEDLFETINEFISISRTNSIFLPREDQQTVRKLRSTLITTFTLGVDQFVGMNNTNSEDIPWKSLDEDFEDLRSMLHQTVQDRIESIREPL